MEAIKNIFGVMMLGVAIWLVFIIAAIGCGDVAVGSAADHVSCYLHAFDALPPNSGGWHKLGKGIGIIVMLLGISLLIGALSGARDMLRPLGALGGGQAIAQTSHLQFERVKNLAELDARVAQASGKTVMLDFYADWWRIVQGDGKLHLRRPQSTGAVKKHRAAANRLNRQQRR